MTQCIPKIAVKSTRRSYVTSLVDLLYFGDSVNSVGGVQFIIIGYDMLTLNKRVIVFTSGGKDSQVTLHKAIKIYGKENVEAIFNDTGWDHPLTYKHIDYLEEVNDIPILRIQGFQGVTKTKPHLKGMVDLIRYKKQFPEPNIRFCTLYLKQYATRNWVRANYEKTDRFTFLFGIRAQESSARMFKYGDLSANELFPVNNIYPALYGKLGRIIKVNFPILRMSRKQVFQYIKNAGQKYNPLYDQPENERVGCYPCLLSKESVQKEIFSTEVGQERWK